MVKWFLKFYLVSEILFSLSIIIPRRTKGLRKRWMGTRTIEMVGKSTGTLNMLPFLKHKEN